MTTKKYCEYGEYESYSQHLHFLFSRSFDEDHIIYKQLNVHGIQIALGIVLVDVVGPICTVKHAWNED